MTDKLIQVFSAYFEIPDTKLSPSTSFRHELNLDEIDLFEALMLVEDEYGVEFPDDVAEKIDTIEQLVSFLD